jgi:type I restriction enzyme, S subunit
VGKVAQVAGLPTPATLGAFISLIRHKESVHPKFLYHQLAWGRTQTRIREMSSNTTNISNVSTKKLATLELVMPDFDEQTLVVAEIEKQFSRLDEAVANLQRVKANLKRYKASVLKDAVEGRLVTTEAELARREGRSFKTGEQLLQRILEVRRSQWQGKGKYKEPIAQDTGEMFGLPDGWATASVEQLTSLVEYGTSAKTNEDSTGVPVLRMGNIVNGEFLLDVLKYLPQNHNEFPKLFVEPGDVLFNRTNSPELVGKTAVFKGAVQPYSYASYLIRMRVVQGYVPVFLAAFINSTHGREWVKKVVTQQVGQANVNGTKLQALVVPLPPSDEQIRIVAELERRVSLVRSVESEVDANLKRAQALRQSTLAKVFSEGQI